MKKRVLFLYVCFFVIILVLSFVVYSNGISRIMKQSSICFEENCISVEVAKTDMEKTKGLMFREKLGEDSGMLFVYEDESDRGFWMKNTLIPLDIIGLDSKKEIVDLHKNLTPCKTEHCVIYPIKSSMYVLEINAGLIEKFNLTVGEKVQINF